MSLSKELILIEKEFFNRCFENKIYLKKAQNETSENLIEKDKNLKSLVLKFNNKLILPEENFKINKDFSLMISKSKIYNIIIEKDLTLEIFFETTKFLTSSINIFVKKGVNLSLLDFSNSEYLYKNLKVVLEENSTLKNSQMILKSKMNFTQVYLNLNSRYDLKAVYNCKKINNFIENCAYNLEEKSKSNLQISGFAGDGAKIINDSKIFIGKNAKTCEGIEKVTNLILDEMSKIHSQPILEVHNNDVICSHACSISQIEKSNLFYLNCRGIDKKEAIDLIISSKFSEVIDFIENDSFKKKYLKIFDNI